jgi:hypothetical protein
VNKHKDDVLPRVKNIEQTMMVKKDIEQLEKLINLRPEMHLFTSLEEKVDRNLKDFRDHMAVFAEDNSEMKLAVRRFDEVIIEKASKIDLHGFEMFVKDNYIK